MLSLHIKVFTLSFKKTPTQIPATPGSYLHTLITSSPTHRAAAARPQPGSPATAGCPPTDSHTKPGFLISSAKGLNTFRKWKNREKTNFNTAVNSTIFRLLLTNSTEDSGAKGFAQSLRVAHWKNQKHLVPCCFHVIMALTFFWKYCLSKLWKVFIMRYFQSRKNMAQHCKL